MSKKILISERHINYGDDVEVVFGGGLTRNVDGSHSTKLSYEGARILQMHLENILGPLDYKKEKLKGSAPIKEVQDILEEAKKTFTDRNKDYKAGHIVHARILKALFPEGVNFNDEEEATRFILFNFMLGKVVRYAVLFNQGGHKDSIHDIGVYSFILESFMNGGMR